MAKRLLRRLLWVVGAALLLALPFVFVPRAWHAEIHEHWIGLGPYPDGPIIDYLVRSVSAVYVLSGLFCWLVATDLGRYGPMVAFLGWASLAWGILMTTVDVMLDLPWWWILGEGVAAIILGVVLVVLARSTNGVSDGRRATGAL